jgi:hypothetical protein
MRCAQELCPNWSGDGDVCPCAVFGRPRPCPHGDPYCPCQDVIDGKRDPCHYEDAAGPPATAAWPAP